MLIKIFWFIRALCYKPFFQRLGSPSLVGKPIFASGVSRISIGKRVRLFPCWRMEAIDKGRIVFHDDVSIGQNFHIISGGEGELEIGSGTVISSNVLITNVDHEYQDYNTPIYRQGLVFKHTKIGRNCFIGFGACIQAGSVLGDCCVVGANSVVKGEFPNGVVLAGAPAKVVKSFSKEKECWI